MKTCLFVMAAALAAAAETISVPAGQTVAVEPGRRFEGGVLVKEGAGTLDLSGAVLANQGLEIRAGAVAMKAGTGGSTVVTRYVRFNVSQTRPAKKGPPEYADSGSQFSEFRLYRDGKVLPLPAGARVLAGPNGSEGPAKGIDGNVKTKCYYNPLQIDLGCEVAFDGYSFVTANDAIGRDPYSWTVDAGVADGTVVQWMSMGRVEKFEAPKERFAEAGRIFPVRLRDKLPPDYPVKVCGKGRLVLEGLTETLEAVSGCGLIELRDATLDIGPAAAFAGTVSGNGAVQYRK
ncbi:MAG: hypothetical protein ACI4Q3_10505 [Kiritimatiellia bacterium]